MSLPFPDLPSSTWFLAALMAFGIGLAKGGIGATMLIVITVMADLFGAKASVGVVLPLLVAADLIAYRLFRAHSSWPAVWKLLLPAFLGIGIGFLILGRIDEEALRRLLGGIILGILVLTILQKALADCMAHLPHSLWFATICGTLAGISTTVANAAGPVFSLYLLARRIPKEEFLGFGVRFFLVLNLAKVAPLAHLGLINPSSLSVSLTLVPAVALGVFAGRGVISRISQSVFDGMMVVVAVIAGVRLLFF
jgi:uncharacterized protein